MERFPFTRPSSPAATGIVWFGCLFAVTAILASLTPASTPALPTAPAAGQAPASSAGAGNGLVTIESDMQQGDNQTGVVTATGNVRITYPDRGMVATSRQAQYFSKEGRLVLSGDVDVIDDQGQRIRAERLVYNLDQERLVAQPIQGQQVRSKLRLTIPQGPAAGASRP
jgi:lipopolysaccharide export system protein LptA